jgi:DNA-binding XRE family transcriptional regulator
MRWGATTGCSPALITSVSSDEFDKHLESLPTLDNLADRFRGDDPEFDQCLAEAKSERYLELLGEVEAGRITRLTAERVQAGLTQAELAARAGLQQPNISRLEKPGAGMSRDTAMKLARALGIESYRVLL